VINNEEIRVKLLERGTSIPAYEQICIDMIVRICKNCIRIYCNIISKLIGKLGIMANSKEIKEILWNYV